MKTFFISFILLFFSVIGFNLYLDKNFFWHRYTAFDNQNLQPGECLKFSGENLSGNDRLSQRNIRKNMPRAELVIFASSRGAYSDYKFFPNKSTYNSATSVALMEDFIDVWMDLKKQNKIPSEVVIFVDGWIFNQSVVHFRSWDSIPGFMEFVKEQNLNGSAAKNQEKYYKKEKLNRLKQSILNLISFSQTETSFKLFASNEYKNLEIKKCDEITDDLTYLTWMGAHVSLKKVTPKELRDIIEDQKSGLPYLDPWSRNEFLVSVFKAFIEDMKKNNVKVHLITPLTNPDSYRWIKENVAVLDYKAILKGLRAIPELEICEVYEADQVPCSNQEFKDGIHMTRECTGKLLRYCGILK